MDLINFINFMNFMKKILIDFVYITFCAIIAGVK